MYFNCKFFELLYIIHNNHKLMIHFEICPAFLFLPLHLVHSGQNHFPLGVLFNRKQSMWNHIILHSLLSQAIIFPDSLVWQKHHVSGDKELSSLLALATCRGYLGNLEYHFPSNSGRTPCIKNLVAFSKASVTNCSSIFTRSTKSSFSRQTTKSPCVTEQNFICACN